MTRTWSIRRRLLLSLLGLLLVGLGGAPLVASYLVGDFLRERGENRVRAVSTVVGGLVSGRDRAVVDAGGFSELAGVADMVVVALDERGEPVAVLDRLGPDVGADVGRPGSEDFASALATDAREGEVVSVSLAGTPFLVTETDAVGLVIRDEDGTETAVTSVVAAYDRSQDVAVVRRLERVGYGFAVVAALLLGLTAAAVLRRGLRPLEQMAERLDRGVVAQGDPDLVLLGRAGGVETARLAVALDQAFAAQRRAERAVRDFVADASHELRTPLTTMSGWLDLWAQGGLEDPVEREAAMGRIEAEVGRMRLLVDELSLLARLDRGRPLDLAPVALGPVLAEIVEDARVVDPDRDYRLEVTGPAAVLGDRDRLFQVFRNLVGNAAQHTPPGTPVVVRAEPDASGLLVTVRDAGPGIAADELERVFERFHRSGGGRREGGSGLGLAIVRSIVEAHGGRVTAESAPGEGTSVRVVLPAVSQPSGPT